MKNNYLKFKILFLLAFLFTFFGMAKSSVAAIIVSENWDSGTPPLGWPCKNIPTSCTSSFFNGWAPRNFDCAVTGGQESDLATDIKYSGTKSFHMYKASGANYTCDINQSFTDRTKIYVSFRIYFPSSAWNSWTINEAEQGDDQGHFFFVNSGLRGPNRIVIDICDAANGTWPGQCWSSGNHAYFKYYWGGEDAQFNSDAAYCWDVMQNLDSWHKITWMFDRTNNKFAHWIDGQQVVGTGGNGIDQSFGDLTNITNFIFSAYRSVNADIVQTYYLEDVIIATELADVERGPDAISPVAPSGLSVQ